ncbi:hypothetical protein AAG570_003270 [Ranatra chinensis]|uniref:Uncharacterized protein n=1 Tax=Ranatra chinensis TaxID=642074 RepID=A0ABD0Y6B1_9HEMI
MGDVDDLLTFPLDSDIDVPRIEAEKDVPVNLPQRLTREVPPNDDPIESQVDCILARQQLKVLRQERNDALPPLSTAYRNHLAFKKLKESRQELEDVRKEIQIDPNFLANLHAKETALVDTIAGFEEFLEENDEKRIRATLARAKETKKLYKAQNEYMTGMLTADNIIFLERLLRKLCIHYAPFERFLSEVAATGKRYKKLTDVTDRYDSYNIIAFNGVYETLNGIRKRLAAVYSKYIDEVELMRNKMFTDAMEITSRILVCVNKLKQAEDLLARLAEKTAYWENRLLEFSGFTMAKYGDHAQVAYFIDSFLKQMVQRGEVQPSVFQLSLEEQVALIRDKYFLLKKVLKNVKKTQPNEDEVKSE